MLLVVMGAGASYDAIPDAPPLPNRAGTDKLGTSRLPLANQLFEERLVFRRVLAQYPELRAIVPHLLDFSENESIETALEGMAGEARAGDAARARQLLSVQFYLSKMIEQVDHDLRGTVTRVTNHATLFDEIRRRTPIGEDVYVVTFNYDLLIEDALSSLHGAQFEQLNSYVQNERFKLIKLHGSVNWSRLLTGRPLLRDGDEDSQLIQFAPTLQYSNDYTMTRRRSQDLIGVPAIAIPIAQKDEFWCPRYHVDELTKFLPSVSKILIIGWKGAEKLFLDLLVRTIRPIERDFFPIRSIGIVGGPDADVTRENIQKAGLTASEYPILRGGFTDFTRGMRRNSWFNDFMRR